MFLIGLDRDLVLLSFWRDVDLPGLEWMQSFPDTIPEFGREVNRFRFGWVVNLPALEWDVFPFFPY